MELQPIGWVRSSRALVVDDDWDRESAVVELDPERFGPEAWQGLDSFSHVEVLFYFDQVEKIETGARRPRGNPDWPLVGIFAQRAKNRPNQIGCTICRILGLDGMRLRLEGLDAVDGTPVLDLKPWMDEFGPRGQTRQPEWATTLMANYWSGPQI